MQDALKLIGLFAVLGLLVVIGGPESMKQIGAALMVPGLIVGGIALALIGRR